MSGDDTAGVGNPMPRLTGITVDGVSVPGFSYTVYAYTANIGNKTSVTVTGAARNDFAVGYRQGSSGSFTTGVSSFTASAPGTVELKVYRRSVGVNDTLAKTYTLNLTSGSEPPAPSTSWRDMIEVTHVEPTNQQPAFYFYAWKVTMTVKPAYVGRIQSITVKSVSAVQQPGVTPETWIASDVVTETTPLTIANLTDKDIVVTLKGSGGGNWPPEIGGITVETLDTSQPAFDAYFSRVTLIINAAYADQIQSITVKGVAAVKQSGTPETWVAANVVSNTKLAPADLAASDIIVTLKGSGGGISREETEIQGSWPNPPISKVTKTDLSQPAFEAYLIDVRVYTNATVGRVTVKGAAAVNQGNGVWKASLTLKTTSEYNSFTLTPGDIVTDYTPPAGPETAKLITSVQIAYDLTAGGYLAYINVDRNEGNNVKNSGRIEVTDRVTGELIASLADGKITQSGVRNYQFGGVLEDPGSSSLDGKTVAVKVTTAAKTDERTGVYGQKIEY